MLLALGLAATSMARPSWLADALAVFPAIAAYVGYTARVNTHTPPLEEQ